MARDSLSDFVRPGEPRFSQAEHATKSLFPSIPAVQIAERGKNKANGSAAKNGGMASDSAIFLRDASRLRRKAAFEIVDEPIDVPHADVVDVWKLLFDPMFEPIENIRHQDQSAG